MESKFGLGLTKTERRGCEKLLRSLPIWDLMSLCDTVTNKMIRVEWGNTREAVTAILTYSHSAWELLNRRKVHREAIFKYLASEGVVMSPHSEKTRLVCRALVLWSAGQTVPMQKPADSLDLPALGQQFCQWFFQMLNSHNPSLGQQPQDWGPQHFWPDAKMSLLSSVGGDGQHTEEEFQGAELVSLRLLALTKEERLLLSPNTEPRGLRTMASAHGPVLVAVAGTIHREAHCLGIYEQAFGLVRSTLDNKWKIKFVNMRIRGGQGALGGAEGASPPALTYDTSELQLLCR